jgi:hypothetical protein
MTSALVFQASTAHELQGLAIARVGSSDASGLGAAPGERVLMQTDTSIVMTRAAGY